MNHLANAIFKEDFGISVMIVFVIIGFLVGFFFSVNSKKEKKSISKMENDANVNQSRISKLKEKIEELEKENKSLGGTSSYS